MSLVAYESSDDEGSENDEKSKSFDARPISKEDEDLQKIRTAKTGCSSVNIPRTNVVKEDEDMAKDFGDDDDWVTEKSRKGVNNKSIFSLLPPPSQNNENYALQEEDDLSESTKLKPDLQLLHKDVDSVKNVPGGEVADNNEQPVAIKRSTKLVLPKPKLSTKSMSKQTMKITLPDVDSDSDEESNEGRKKMKSQGKKGIGLLGCLPKPKNSVRTEVINLNKSTERRANRIMVPYTLSKKKEEKQKKILINKDSESESDDEETPSFFSLTEKTQNEIVEETKSDLMSHSSENSKVSLKGPSLHAGEIAVKENDGTFDSKLKLSQNAADSGFFNKTTKTEQGVISRSSSSFNNKESYSSASYRTGGTSNGIEPVTRPYMASSVAGPSGTHSVTGPYGSSAITGPYGAGSVTGQYSTENVTGPYGAGSVTGPYGPNSATGPNGTTSVTGPYGSSSGNQRYQQNVSGPYHPRQPFGTSHLIQQYGATDVVDPYQSVQNLGQRDAYSGGFGTSGSAYLNPAPSGHYGQYQEGNQHITEENNLDIEQLKRLQGKRERGLQEVDIIDIKGENMQMGSIDLLKNASEGNTHISKKFKSDNVSSQQKKKHQITYLAFQAKEREQELRKSWAAGQQTKRQSQQKYGF